MNVIRFDDLQFDAQPQFPLPSSDLDNQAPTVCVVKVRRSIRRHRNDLSWMPVALFALAALSTVCVFAKNLVESDDPPRRPRPSLQRVEPKRTPAHPIDAAPSSQVAHDLPNSVHRSGKSRQGGSATVPPSRGNPSATAGPRDSQQMAEALRACRESRFDDAKAIGKTLGGPDGLAVCLLADYLRQYEKLSRDAILRMNGAVEVDLGPNHGVGAFVDHIDGTLVFMCRGRHVRIPVDEFDDLTAARFRITRQFVANGGMPANDLILAAAHFVYEIDDEGESDADGHRAREAARSHLMVATSASDPDVAKQAKMFLTLIGG